MFFAPSRDDIIADVFLIALWPQRPIVFTSLKLLNLVNGVGSLLISLLGYNGGLLVADLTLVN